MTPTASVGSGTPASAAGKVVSGGAVFVGGLAGLVGLMML